MPSNEINIEHLLDSSQARLAAREALLQTPLSTAQKAALLAEGDALLCQLATGLAQLTRDILETGQAQQVLGQYRFPELNTRPAGIEHNA